LLTQLTVDVEFGGLTAVGQNDNDVNAPILVDRSGDDRLQRRMDAQRERGLVDAQRVVFDAQFERFGVVGLGAVQLKQRRATVLDLLDIEPERQRRRRSKVDLVVATTKCKTLSIRDDY
jgi:hypothetical protein